jgi:hypothetical protein
MPRNTRAEWNLAARFAARIRPRSLPLRTAPTRTACMRPPSTRSLVWRRLTPRSLRAKFSPLTLTFYRLAMLTFSPVASAAHAAGIAAADVVPFAWVADVVRGETATARRLRLPNAPDRSRPPTRRAVLRNRTAAYAMPYAMPPTVSTRSPLWRSNAATLATRRRCKPLAFRTFGRLRPLPAVLWHRITAAPRLRSIQSRTRSRMPPALRAVRSFRAKPCRRPRRRMATPRRPCRRSPDTLTAYRLPLT